MTDSTKTQTRVPAVAATVLRINPTTKAVDPEGWAAGLTLTFANGQRLSLVSGQLTDEMQMEALVHGLKQKLVDAAAISRNATTGKSATADDKYEAVKEVYDRLLAGKWNADREGGGAGSLLFKALCRMYADKQPAVLREWLDKKTDAEKAALRKNPKLATIIAEIQAEQLKTEGIDTDAMLNDLS